MAGKWSQVVQIGREATSGTAVAATTIWRGTGNLPKNNQTVTVKEEMLGITSGNTTDAYTPKLEAGITLNSTECTFEQWPHLLEMGFKAITPTQDGTGTGYVYTALISDTSEDTRETYTIEGGDSQQFYELEYGFAQSISLSWSAQESVMMSAEIIGRQLSKVSKTAALTVPAAEVVLGGKGSLYIDSPSGSAFGAEGTQITGTLLSGELTFNTGLKPKYISDDGQLYFNFVYLDSSAFGIEGSFVYEHDTNAVAEYDAYVANTPRVFRVKFTGDAPSDVTGATYSNKVLIVDFVATYTDFSELTDEDGNGIVTATFKGGYDLTEANSFQFITVNEINDTNWGNF